MRLFFECEHEFARELRDASCSHRTVNNTNSQPKPSYAEASKEAVLAVVGACRQVGQHGKARGGIGEVRLEAIARGRR